MNPQSKKYTYQVWGTSTSNFLKVLTGLVDVLNYISTNGTKCTEFEAKKKQGIFATRKSRSNKWIADTSFS
jgi:hypothetical protein